MQRTVPRLELLTPVEMMMLLTPRVTMPVPGPTTATPLIVVTTVLMTLVTAVRMTLLMTVTPERSPMARPLMPRRLRSRAQIPRRRPGIRL